MDPQKKFEQFRKEYPLFRYDAFEAEVRDDQLHIRYFFSVPGRFQFAPFLTIPFRKIYGDFHTLPEDQGFRQLVFQLGLVEMISYWKAFCSPEIVVVPGALDKDMIAWWKKLFFLGLGEFRFTNGIQVGPGEFVDIRCSSHYETHLQRPPLKDGYIVPVGGGKDSAVTLDILTRHTSVVPMLLNPSPAMLRTIRIKDFDKDASVVFHRHLDPLLLKMNGEGFLNGHTPFSALLAFLSLIASRLTGIKHVALSNEASANESSIPGTDINHQYSKTYGFEKDFREYCSRFLGIDSVYFSFLRPLLELQIARIFSRMPAYFKAIRSCNAGSREDKWCRKCSKCLFAWIILYPYLELDQLDGIFGGNLFEDPEQWENLQMLAGLQETKPFECIGTIGEVRQALRRSHIKAGDRPPLLLEKYGQYCQETDDFPADESSFLHHWNHDHFLPDEALHWLTQAWKNSNNC
ncbi:MAG TPA: hypothetical protein P5531_10880 [Bacteroidales bacterium]|nr:hypothetical protein [Bacteroidales bacterium]HSA44066.1 hypothetical protein [Bacteroidales bacterium]